MAAVHHVHNKLSWEQVLEKFHEVHGNKYIYDEKSYKDTHTKMRMYCSETDEEGNIHGWFEQSPSKHIHLKQGCKKCAGVEKHTLESFKKAAIKVHGERFDLSGITEYVNNRGIVYPICHEKDENGVEHGAFSVTVHNFLRGRGCPKCKNKRISQSETKTTEEYIEQVKKIHGDDYDYSELKYIGANKDVYIICHKRDYNGIEHGGFWQKATVHLMGCGCSKCAKSKLETSFREICDVYNIHYKNDYKDNFDGLRNDFYLPDYNVIVECQGIQHFRPTRFGGISEERAKICLEYMISNDIKKYNIANKLGIKIYYFISSKIFSKEFLDNNLYQRIYQKDNVFTDIEKLIKKIKGEI